MGCPILLSHEKEGPADPANPHRDWHCCIVGMTTIEGVIGPAQKNEEISCYFRQVKSKFRILA